HTRSKRDWSSDVCSSDLRINILSIVFGGNMEYQELYESWLNDDFFDKETREELLSIKGDYDEVRDRFYKNLEFGTAGLRGKIGEIGRASCRKRGEKGEGD